MLFSRRCGTFWPSWIQPCLSSCCNQVLFSRRCGTFWPSWIQPCLSNCCNQWLYLRLWPFWPPKGLSTRLPPAIYKLWHHNYSSGYMAGPIFFSRCKDTGGVFFRKTQEQWRWRMPDGICIEKEVILHTFMGFRGAVKKKISIDKKEIIQLFIFVLKLLICFSNWSF
jgi:hypothetical protein